MAKVYQFKDIIESSSCMLSYINTIYKVDTVNSKLDWNDILAAIFEAK